MSDEIETAVDIEDPGSVATLAKMTVTEIEHSVAALPETLSHDQVLEWMMLALVLVQRAKEIKQQVDQVALTWVKAHGPLQNGPVRYTAGQSSQTKCTDVISCMRLLLDHCGGDIDALCTYLRSDPYRYGECSKSLDEQQFRQVFQTIIQEKIVLRAIDTRFVASRSSHSNARGDATNQRFKESK